MRCQKIKTMMLYNIAKKHLKGALTFFCKYKNLFIFQVSIRNFFFKRRLWKNFKQIRSVLIKKWNVG